MGKVLELLNEKLNNLKQYGVYVNNAIVKQNFENVNDDTLVDDLYEKYTYFLGEVKRTKNLIKECKDDFCYWGYVSNEQTYEAIVDIYLAIINLKTGNNLVNGTKYIHVNNEKDHYKNKYNKILQKIEEEKKGLLKYKPSGYKSKIELLESLLKG